MGTEPNAPKKRSVWKLILLCLVAIVAIFLVVVAVQPPEYRVVRDSVVAAPAAVVFEQINDLHKWEGWSPWAKLDPAVKNTFEGPPVGTGAVFAWAGNSKVGEGRMTITDSRPHDLIKIKLDFIKPFASTADTEFTFKAEGDKTLVSWSMAGQKNFLSKAFCLFMNMDKMIGGDFERGFANLKSVLETPAKN
jgi:hypothetical protein